MWMHLDETSLRFPASSEQCLESRTWLRRGPLLSPVLAAASVIDASLNWKATTGGCDGNSTKNNAKAHVRPIPFDAIPPTARARRALAARPRSTADPRDTRLP